MATEPRGFLGRHPLLTSYLFFGSLSIIYHALIYGSGMAGSVGLRQALIMSSLWLIPVLLWPQKIRLIAAITGALLLPASLISFGYWLLYGQEFSQSVIFIIFESYPAESREFLQSYLRWWHPLAFIAYLAIPVCLWRQLQPAVLSYRTQWIGVSLVLLTTTWPFFGTLLVKQQNLDSAVYHQLHRMEPAAPWSLLVGYSKYRQVMANMNAIINENATMAPLVGLKTDEQKLPELLVLVIGESTNRQRMSLYGYNRPTTPKLDGIRDQLTVFNDVISPRPYTIEALQQVLSFADQTDPDAFFSRPNLLNMLKQAGYHTTWITNQQTQTRRNTLLTSLAQIADEQIYLNNNRDQNASQYDDAVLAPFEKSLETPHQRKTIIVHLLGTHRKYDYRYPAEFQRFNDTDNAPSWINEDIIEEYNSYDNAIAFNDHVVHSLISKLDADEQKSLLVYFSDHGEEVYDQPDPLFCGRNEGRPTTTMYTVPFIVWQSDQSSREQWQAYEDRPYQTSDFIHTLADMMGIRFDHWDPSRSLVNERFNPHPRLIGDPHSSKLTSFEQLQQTTLLATQQHDRDEYTLQQIN